MRNNYLRVLTTHTIVLMLSFLYLPILAVAQTNTWDGTSKSSVTATGTGESGSPYEISTGAQLAQLAADVNGGTSYKDIFFKLTTDIDLNSKEWTPIGKYNKTFQGNFDGNGHVIKGLTVQNAQTVYVGLFGYTEGASIQNLGVYIDSKGLLGNYNDGYGAAGSVGGIVGYNKGSGKIENCYTTGGKIMADATINYCLAGGIVGFAYNGSSSFILSNCYSTCEVEAKGNGIVPFAGGIAGSLEGTISYSYATGTVTSAKSTYQVFAGGIIGKADRMTASNLLALNIGGITAEVESSGTKNSGRIVGILSNSTLTNSYASSKITGNWNDAEAGKKDGANTYIDTYQSEINWDTNIWTLSENNLPFLKKIKDAPVIATNTYLANSTPDPDPTPTPPPYIPTYYSVTLHPAEGAVCKPKANTYVVEEWYNFSFTLALEEGYQSSTPVVKANGIVIEPRVSDGKYILRSVTEDTDIIIEGIMKDEPTSNTEVGGTIKVQAADGILHIYLSQDETVSIFTASGLLYKETKLAAGSNQMQLSRGIYFVKIAGKTYKVAF